MSDSTGTRNVCSSEYVSTPGNQVNGKKKITVPQPPKLPVALQVERLTGCFVDKLTGGGVFYGTKSSPLVLSRRPVLHNCLNEKTD